MDCDNEQYSGIADLSCLFPDEDTNAEIEALRQKLHSAEMKLKCLSEVKFEMQIELEALNGLHVINGDLETRIKILEMKITEKDARCADLEVELEEEKNKRLAVEKNSAGHLEGTVDKMKKENDEGLQTLRENFQTRISFLEASNEELLREKEAFLKGNEELSRKVYTMEDTVNEKTQELDELKNMLENKREELRDAQNLIEELKEEQAVINAEVSNLKASVPHSQRGNSLFAEVENKRLSTAAKYETMCHKYKELKKMLMRKNAALLALENENQELRKKWEKDENAPYETMGKLLESYKIRISDLMSMVAHLEKRPESPQIIAISDVTQTHVDSMKAILEEERKIIRQLHDEMEQRSMREMAVREQIYTLKRDSESAKAKFIKKEAECRELEVQINAYKEQGNNTTIFNEESELPAYMEKKCNKSVRFESILEPSRQQNHQPEQVFKKPTGVKFQKVKSVKIGDKENSANL